MLLQFLTRAARYSFGYRGGYVCVFTSKNFFVGFHEFGSEIGVFDGAEHDADIFSSSFCRFARFLDYGFFVPFFPQMYPHGYICG